MKKAAKMTVVNAVKMMARAEMHFSWENFGISNLIKFDILHSFTENHNVFDNDDNGRVLQWLWLKYMEVMCLHKPL